MKKLLFYSVPKDSEPLTLPLREQHCCTLRLVDEDRAESAPPQPDEVREDER